MSEIRRQTLSGVKWSAIERFSVQGIQFLLGLIIARILSPSDYGVVAVLGIFMAVSQSFIDSGFSNALIRKIDRMEVDFSTVFYFNIVVGIICYVIMYVAAPLIAVFFKQPLLTDITRVLSLNLFLSSLTVVQVAKLTIKIDFKTQGIINLVATLLSGALGVYWAWKGYGVWTLVYQSVTGSVIRTLLLWGLSRWRPQLVYSWKSFQNLFSYGSKLLASGLLHTVYSEMSTIAIGRYYTTEDLGNYARGQAFSSLPSSNITGILQRVTFPILARIQNEEEHLVEVYRKYIKLTSMCIFFLMVLLAALAKPLVLCVLTDKWSGAVIFLQIFCFAMMFDHICQLNLNLLQVKGRSVLFLKLEIIKKIIAVGILLVSIPWGVLAICISKIIYTQIAVYINTYYTGKLFYLGYMQQMRDFMPYLGLSLVACSLVWVLSLVVENNFVLLFLGAVCSTAVYVWFLYAKKDSLFMEFVWSYVCRKILRRHV
ncbi:MAG: lipopolysaccharide biosynthesis protein [Prevotellaceae bacterium]|nr:lipopolysaccharide biosynthesis protein [Prevotellaceae bacterium]